MSDLRINLVPQSPFEGILAKPTHDRSLIVTDRHGLGIATVLVRGQTSMTLAERVHEHLGIELPHGPYRVTAEQLAFAGIGPGAWLATHERGDRALTAMLRPVTQDLASIFEQGDGYAVLRLSGPRVRDTLGKLIPLDLHPSAFNVGCVAVTTAGHMAATLWRLEDSCGAPVFELAVPRSFSACLWCSLSENAPEHL